MLVFESLIEKRSLLEKRSPLLGNCAFVDFAKKLVWKLMEGKSGNEREQPIHSSKSFYLDNT